MCLLMRTLLDAFLPKDLLRECTYALGEAEHASLSRAPVRDREAQR